MVGVMVSCGVGVSVAREVAVLLGVNVAVFRPINVGVEVNVSVGVTGVAVGSGVCVIVLVEEGVAVASAGRNCPTEHESEKRMKMRRAVIFFMGCSA